MCPTGSGAHAGVMFNHPSTTDALRRQHGDRLMDVAARHRRIFSRRQVDATPAASLATVVMLPTRVDRTSPRDSRVA